MVAQESNKWEKVNCSGIEQIDFDQIIGFTDNSNGKCYICSQQQDYYSFTPTEIKKISSISTNITEWSVIHENYLYELESNSAGCTIHKNNLTNNSIEDFLFNDYTFVATLLIMDNQLYGIMMNSLFSLTLSSGNATMEDFYNLEYSIYNYDSSNEIIFSSTVVGFNNTIYY